MNKRPANHRVMQAVRTICARRSSLSVPAVALLGFSMVSVSLAGPTGGVVVDGQATISTPNVGTTVIDQASQHVQLNWSTFDVGANESVQFQQPSSSAVAVNRILDQNASQIFGRIDANGQVILVNPNGMLFGASAQLNVGSLVASSLEVIGFDAATGRYTFGTSRADVGAIVNDGAITAASGGSVTLLGGRVTNTGSIVADFGTVNLAAGRAATLDLAGDGLLRLEVDGELLSNDSGAGAAVENAGVIEAHGGQVLLTAKAVDDVFANLVNNTGVVRANRIDDSGGTIRLIGAGGTVRSSGVLDASAGDAVSSGGTVQMLGEQVGLFGAALVDVSGATSGGTALIGGDYQGKNPDVLNAARTYVSADSSVRADAGAAGDGGRVIVWADEITRFNGSISARGGALSGNGGFAEVSGKEMLVFRGTANLSAANGFAGELLLDPRNIIVATGGEGDLAGDTGDDGVANDYAFAEDVGDDITIAPDTITGILDTGTTVTLQAHNDITVTDAIDGSASTTPGGGLIFQAGDDIFINADVRTNNGAIHFTAGDDNATPTGGNGDDAPTGELTLASGVTLAAGAATVTLNSDSDMQLLGTVSGDGITATSGGTLTVGTLNAGTGAVNLLATGSLLDDGNNGTRITGGVLTLTATEIGDSGPDGEIDTSVSSLNATTTNGSIYIGESNGLILASVSAVGAGSDVNVTSATGNIVANDVTAADDVALTATTGNISVAGISAGDAATLTATAGSITDDSLNSTRIAAGVLTMTAGTAIGALGANDQIDTDVTSLTASAGNGGVYIGELNGLTLTNVSAAGAGNDVVVTSATGNIVATSVSAADDVTLTATTGDISATSINATDAVTLTATAGNIQATSITAGGAANLTATAGDIQVASINAGGAANLTATAGSITDDGDNATRIAAGALTLSAGTAIGATGATGQIDTDVTSLTASAGNGGVYIGELNGLTLTNVSAAGAGNDVVVTSATGNILATSVTAADDVTLTATTGDISATSINATDAVTLTATAGNIQATSITAGGAANLTATAGDIQVASINAGGAVTLAATAGAITDDDNDSTVIAGGSVSLSAATNIGTVVDFAAANDADVGSSLDVQTSGALTASVTSSSGQINLNISGAPTLAGGAITLGSGSNRAGAIVLQSAGNLNVAGLAPGAINIGSNNTTSVGLRSGGVLTLPSSGGFTDQPADRLLVRGATDVVDNDGTPREFTLSATSLDFRSGAAGGATILNTTVDELSASVGNDQNLTVNETDGVTLGTLDAGNGNIFLTAGGAVTDDGDDATRVVSNTATLAGASLGTAGSALDTQVSTLTATASSGGTYIREVDGLALTASATGGEVDVRTAGGALTVASASGGGVTLVAGGAGSALTLNGAVTAGTGDVTLTAGTVASRGAIVAGVGSQVTGDALTAAGSNIGSSAARLNTTVSSVNATSTSGGIFITEADAVSVAANATGGAVDVATTNGALTVAQATGNAVTLTAGGAGSGIALNGAVNAGAGSVTLTAGTAASGAIVAGAGNQITGGSLTASGSMIGTSGARLNTTIASLDATSTNGGIFITEANALTLTANATNGAADVRTTNGALVVTAMTGDGATLVAGGAGNGITLNGAVNAGTGDVTLTAGTAGSRGAIVAGAGSQITGGALTATGSTIGTGAARLNTTVASLDATSTNGSIFITESDALSVTALATNGAADVRTTNGALTVTSVTGEGVTLTAGGDASSITLNGAVNAGIGDVVLTAGTVANRGAIVAGAGNEVIGDSLTASGSVIGTSAARLNTNVDSLNATSTNGGIFVTEADASSLTASATNGIADVRTTSGALVVSSVTGNGVTLSAGGAGNGITLNGAVNAGTGDVSMMAGTAASRGAIVAGAGNQVIGGALTASGSAIGTDAARLNTTVASLDATSTSGGVFIAESDALSLTASATGGAVDVQTGSGSLTVGAVSGDGVTLTAGGAGSAITLNGALNAGANDVTLTAGTTASRGAIVGTAGHSISGRSLTAMAATIGASNARLNTSIDALTAVASTGDLYITEQNGLTLANVSAANSIDVNSATGDIVVNVVDAANSVTLSAAAGAIADDGDDSTRLSANALTLSARSIGAASTLSGATLNSTARLDTDVTTLNATATAGGIFIDEADGLQNVIVQASGGGAGDIELLTAAGDLTLQHVNASDTLLLAAGRNIVSAPGASAVTARVAELRAGTTDANGGRIGTLSDLIEFQLSAGNSLRLFVPQTVDPNDPDRAPATLPSAGVTTTLNLFASPSAFAARAGFNQFQGLGETQFSSPAETLVRTLQSQTGTVQTGLDIDWGSFDPDVSLFGTLEPSVCLPADQRDEEVSTPDC